MVARIELRQAREELEGAAKMRYESVWSSSSRNESSGQVAPRFGSWREIARKSGANGKKWKTRFAYVKTVFYVWVVPTVTGSGDWATPGTGSLGPFLIDLTAAARKSDRRFCLRQMWRPGYDHPGLYYAPRNCL